MDDSLDAPSAGATFMRQIEDLWLGPELDARGDSRSTAVTKALVIFPAEGPNRVLLNDEATLIAEAKAARTIAEGEPVTAADLIEIRNLRPAEVDPNAGWIAFAQTGEGRIVAFDFRRNKERAGARLDSADEFLASAESDLTEGRIRPAIDNCYAAAELASDAHMLPIGQLDKRTPHGERRRWMRQWSELGNVPKEHSRCLAELAKYRGRARYGGAVNISAERVRGWIETTRSMIDLARLTLQHV